MIVEIKAPVFPESVADGTVATWYKKSSEVCARDEHIVDIETDKVVLEVVAPADGILEEVFKGESDVVLSAEVLATFRSEETVFDVPNLSAHSSYESIEIKTPSFPESVADGIVAAWYKKPGETCSRDDLVVDIETDKVVLEVVAPAEGVIGEVVKNEGDTVLSSEVLATFLVGALGNTVSPSVSVSVSEFDGDSIVGPAARKTLAEAGLSTSQVKGTGKEGRITKEDVDTVLKVKTVATQEPKVVLDETKPDLGADGRIEKRVPMTRLQSTIAKRLVEVQQTTAQLTTYNEVEMGSIIELCKKYKKLFMKTHGIKLGFMSFFVKATTEALKRFPAVNASIDGNDIVYHGYQDIGVAVSTDRGLIVPVLRNTEVMELADIESTIMDFSIRDHNGELDMNDMQGGTFTITNSGTFGSLLSTPIINAPQTAILGMHKIQERPMVVNGRVVIQPMMYLALSYDHRMIDGKEAVQFLAAIKDILEDSSRFLLNV